MYCVRCKLTTPHCPYCTNCGGDVVPDRLSVPELLKIPERRKVRPGWGKTLSTFDHELLAHLDESRPKSRKQLIDELPAFPVDGVLAHLVRRGFAWMSERGYLSLLPEVVEEDKPWIQYEVNPDGTLKTGSLLLSWIPEWH